MIVLFAYVGVEMYPGGRSRALKLVCINSNNCAGQWQAYDFIVCSGALEWSNSWRTGKHLCASACVAGTISMIALGVLVEGAQNNESQRDGCADTPAP